MYWYMFKDSVDRVFVDVRRKIMKDLNVFEFYKLIVLLVAFFWEDYIDILCFVIVKEKINSEVRLLFLSVVFLGK